MAYGKSRLTNPEIIRLELDPPSAEARAILAHTSRQLRRVANLCVRIFLRHHDQRQTLLRMSAGCPAVACPPELCARWLREAQALCPDVQSGTVLAVTNWLAQTYGAQKSPRSNRKRWLAVLDASEAPWHYRDPLPIRLWNGNAKIVRSGSGAPALVARLDRIDSGGKLARSTPLHLTLRRPTAGQRSESHRAAYAAAAEIADGQRALAQSQLVQQRGKWFLMLTVSGPEPMAHAARDKNKIVVIRPGRHSALRMRTGALAGGFGDEALDSVAHWRAKLDARRRSCRTDLGSVPAGVSEHLSDVWRGQANAICDRLVKEVCDALASRHFGTVLWLDGDNRTAALALAGRAGERDRRELFPFERLRWKASRALAKIGIEVVERANFRSVKRRIEEHGKRVRAVVKKRDAGGSGNADRSQKRAGRVAAQALMGAGQ